MNQTQPIPTSSTDPNSSNNPNPTPNNENEEEQETTRTIDDPKQPILAKQKSTKLTHTQILVVIVFLVGFQLLHSFDPAQPFTVQIGIDLGLSNEDLFNKLAPFRAYFLLPSSILVGLLYEVLGYRFALGFLFAALVLYHALLCVAVLLRPAYSTVMSLYRAAYYWGSYSFSTGFVVNCALFSLLPPSAYQAATSANSIAMMVGSLLASFAGQGLVHAVPNIGDLFYISLAIAAAALLILLVGVCAGALPRAERVMSTSVWLRRVWARLLFYHRCSDVLEWSIFSAVNLALHTLVKGMWKSLFHDIDPESGQFNNGLINGVTCLAAAICMFAMSVLPRATERAARSILCLFPFVNGLIFVAMALSPTVLIGTCFFVAYNALCECVLVLGNVMMAKAMGRAEENAVRIAAKKEKKKKKKSEPDAKKEGNSEEEEEKEEKENGDGAVVVDDDDNNNSDDEEVKAKAKKLVDFALVFTVNYCVSIIVQNLYNAFAVHVFKFDSYGWFFGFAVVASLLGIGVVISSIVHGVRGHLKVM